MELRIPFRVNRTQEDDLGDAVRAPHEEQQGERCRCAGDDGRGSGRAGPGRRGHFRSGCVLWIICEPFGTFP